ncbi:hypothetical protein [Lentzea sp. NBRC 105346]|uniref:hypothetical protein n=1 Tax=Lentzea sp. NBRC 105346 TaxID=3032205 RepID=UPI002556E06C|nr:hypothetical protein [Lentzea sp. NBRC 105346]
MAVSSKLLIGELKALRRGRGVHTPGLDRHVGPALREACGISDCDGAEVVREKLGAWVADLVRTLPDDLRLAVTTPLGLNPDAQHVFLAHRVEWLASRLQRDSRTVRRRIDDGLTRLVEAALHPAQQAQEDWYVARIQVLLRLDAPSPVRVEQWTVIALRDGVDQIPLPCSANFEVVYGAVPDGRALRFPRPLRTGETHEFCVQAPLLTPATYVHRCERFDLVVDESAPRVVPPPRTGLESADDASGAVPGGSRAAG